MEAHGGYYTNDGLVSLRCNEESVNGEKRAGKDG